MKEMVWANSDENSNKKGANLRKSVSSIGFNEGLSNLSLREARSFTGALEELKNSTKLQNHCQHEHNINYHDQMYNKEQEASLCENGYVTKEVCSDQIFLVKDELLTYRGRKYSLNDIATRWKKDCRMWLWKNKMDKKKNKSVEEIREKIENLKIPSRSSLA